MAQADLTPDLPRPVSETAISPEPESQPFEASATPLETRPEPSPPAADSPQAVPSWILWMSLAVMLGFIVVKVPQLVGEIVELRRHWDVNRRSQVIGFKDINPSPSYANRPKNWFHDEGEFTLIWSGWKSGVGHRWFRIGRGELQVQRLSGIFGRDVIRAIDWPVVEIGGGPRWDRLPVEELVVTFDLDAGETAYPLRVLEKVEVVNEVVRGQPVLIVYSPLEPIERAVSVFFPTLNGHRVTLGLSGYFHDRQPLLYDRGTESLWVNNGHGLEAIAGPLRGTRLKEAGAPTLLSWGQWLASHPGGRLVVGADRSRGLPSF